MFSVLSKVNTYTRINKDLLRMFSEVIQTHIHGYQKSASLLIFMSYGIKHEEVILLGQLKALGVSSEVNMLQTQRYTMIC